MSRAKVVSFFATSSTTSNTSTQRRNAKRSFQSRLWRDCKVTASPVLAVLLAYASWLCTLKATAGGACRWTDKETASAWNFLIQ